MSEAGYDVTLLDRRAEHVATLRTHGLFIDGIRGEERVPVRALMPHELRGPLEAVIVATKSQHTLEAVAHVLPLLGDDGFIVSYQNGFNEPDIGHAFAQADLGDFDFAVFP